MKRYIQVIFICWLSINSITEVYGKDPIVVQTNALLNFPYDREELPDESLESSDLN